MTQLGENSLRRAGLVLCAVWALSLHLGPASADDSTAIRSPEAAHPAKAIPYTYPKVILADGLQGPDGLAIHPTNRMVYFSEEDAARIMMLRDGRTTPVIDRDTPLYTLRRGKRTPNPTPPLRNPEGLTFASNGDLYVVEDYPGGRLLRFPVAGGSRYPAGEVVPVPGDWGTFAWEGVAVGPQGDILMAGSDLEYAMSSRGARAFMGVVLYRDKTGQWWVPHRRPFASFSSVQFTAGGRQAVYTCEVSGEVGWIDLQERRPVGGCSTVPVRAPEGIAVMPDGRLMVALESGTLICVDPAVDRHDTVMDNLGSLESVAWDPFTRSIILTEQTRGEILSLKARFDFTKSSNRMDLAVYHPLYNPRHVPEKPPPYLSRVLALGGLDYERIGLPPLSFREFTDRVPLIAADAKTTCLNPESGVEDPLERVQFVVFQPNQLLLTETGPSPSLALFATRSRSGKITATSILRAETQGFTFENPKPEPLGSAAMAVPMAAGIGVSALGIASINFMGLGKTPDYSVVLNPTQPYESYLIVFQDDGSRIHYQLDFTEPNPTRESWVVAFTESQPDEWLSLGRPEQAP